MKGFLISFFITFMERPITNGSVVTFLVVYAFMKECM